ncbi:MAG: cytochrome c biogenesis protein CcsA [Bacteroidetes bacterium]|nr:cytochrome c biogenesis protein CcsA [Bacteroidota bacterium]
MKEIIFQGEQLWPGNLGHFFVVLSTVAAMAGCWLYYRAANTGSDNLRSWGRRLTYIQAFSVLAIFVVLFGIIFMHRYEYYYAWRHSSNELPVYYMISCFWEGQEGSFLLWMFWNAVLGLILLRTAKAFEAPVMAVILFAQFALSTMILGVDLEIFKVGSSPFNLLRDERADLLNIPVLAQMGQANYLKIFNNGNGLNPLLQNYWMVIHPPTLFFGFATAIVPFAYSIAGLWTGSDRKWIQPALIWGLICVGVLGTGIIMGGFWAYESLSFGGYWAWDPVENASLMPWLLMAAAAHMLVISKSTGRHLFASHVLIHITFWLVLYATFLTRSGILGNASVHSFTDLGLSKQLLLFLFGFILISVVAALPGSGLRKKTSAGFLLLIASFIAAALLVPAKSQGTFNNIAIWTGIVFFLGALVLFFYYLYRRTKIEMEDEKWLSRELWMFLGSIFLILCLLQVISATSIPVFNKLFGRNIAVPDAGFYNRFQLILAMPVMFLMALGQWLRYRETDAKIFLRDLLMTATVAAVVTVLCDLSFGILEIKYLLFLFLATWLVVANGMYLLRNRQIPLLSYGAGIAHAGFGLLLIGVLVSSVNQKILTSTSKGIEIAPELDTKGKVDEKGVAFNRENRILYQNKPAQVGEWTVTYRNATKGLGRDSIDKYFHVYFEKKNAAGRIQDSFTLSPKAQNNPKMGLIAEPSTRHFISRDIFTHVNFESGLEKTEPFSGYTETVVSPGETFLTASGKIKMRIDSVARLAPAEGTGIRLRIRAERLEDTALLYPVFNIDLENNKFEPVPAISNELGLMALITNIEVPKPDAPGEKVHFLIRTGERTPQKSYIVIKAIEFPWINLVWAGTIIMVIGASMAVYNRILQQRKLQA